MEQLKQYQAALYVRLSKEDGDKEESDSIVHQKTLIRDFAASKPDIQIVCEFVDDGKSGADFDRPAFQKMMTALESGEINAVLTKDLSRFGRNFIETGRYLSTIFPAMGVRFIAINDGIDSAAEKTAADNIIMPVRNLINDAFLRDISIKVRSQLETKRKKGEFIGAFPQYGYLRDPENRHKLVVDSDAAQMVRAIFQWKLEGMSQKGIADKLNVMGILSPAEYKRAFCGFRYRCGFQLNSKALWSAVAVGRILRNETYLGTLIQGKRTTPNHKVKKEILKPEEQWSRVENSHPAIISKEDFAAVQRLLQRDTRVAPGENAVQLFGGIAFCGDCHRNMVRNGVNIGGRLYVYYLCGKNRAEKSCTSHRVSQEALEQAVLQSLQWHIAAIVDMERMLTYIESLPFQQDETRKLDAMLTKKREEIARYERLKKSLYESLEEKIIKKEEYLELKASYEAKRQTALREEQRLIEEQDILVQSNRDERQWIERFKKYQGIQHLNRHAISTMIEHIHVYEGNRVDIRFLYQYDYERALGLIADVGKVYPLPGMEAI